MKGHIWFVMFVQHDHLKQDLYSLQYENLKQ